MDGVRGGREPFGKDWQAGTGAGYDATQSGVFLRLPGQWIDASWTTASLGVDLYQNAFRYLEPAAGRYVSPDPEPNERNPKPFLYARSNPLEYVDPWGLFSWPLTVAVCSAHFLT